MARRIGMRRRQPEMQRHHARLKAEPQQGQRKQQEEHSQSGFIHRQRPQHKGSGHPVKQGHQSEQGECAGMRGSQIDPACTTHLGQMEFRADQEKS